MSREGVEGFLVVASPVTFSQRAQLAELALAHRLPGMFGSKENVEAGGLISYGADLNDLARRSAAYIDKILKGAKPADLPVEQASKYQLGAIALKIDACFRANGSSANHTKPRRYCVSANPAS